MTSTAVPADLRRALRQRAQVWIARLYRHEILTARTVRGMQLEAAQKFDEVILRPMLRAIGARLAGFEPRGADVVVDAFPELVALREEIERIAANGTDAVRRLSTERLFEFTKNEAEWLSRTTSRALQIETARPTDQAIQTAVVERPFLGEKVEGWFSSMLKEPVGNKVRAWVQTGLQRGLTTDEIVRGLRGTAANDYEDGILTGQSRNAVATLVRTAATHASTVARQESFKMLGVKTWRFVATLDSKTSIQCAANDGKTFPLGKGPMPPLHPNCRSTAVPDFGSPIGERASIDGPVPADQTFRDWLETQPVATQNEVLGKTKAEAWRSGKLSIDQMLGRDLEPLTIAELRALDRIPQEEEEA